VYVCPKNDWSANNDEDTHINNDQEKKKKRSFWEDFLRLNITTQWRGMEDCSRRETQRPTMKDCLYGRQACSADDQYIMSNAEWLHRVRESMDDCVHLRGMMVHTIYMCIVTFVNKNSVIPWRWGRPRRQLERHSFLLVRGDRQHYDAEKTLHAATHKAFVLLHVYA